MYKTNVACKECNIHAGVWRILISFTKYLYHTSSGLYVYVYERVIYQYGNVVGYVSMKSYRMLHCATYMHVHSSKCKRANVKELKCFSKHM